MTKLIQQSANSYAVVVGEVIDHTHGSLKAVTDLLWEGINSFGQSKKFKTRQEAMNFAAR
jgi:hypothetical protein